MNFSLDFWNTIAQPNTEFSYQRNLLIANKLNVPIQLIKEEYSTVKKSLDTIAEYYGAGNTVTSAFSSLGIALANKICKQSASSEMFDIYNAVISLKKDIQNLFLKYPPHINSSTINVIQELRNAKHKLCITSNTNFISGDTISLHLKKINLYYYIDYYVFSDEVGMSKPNPKIFNMVKQIFGEDKIIHIGDHPVCDNSGDIFEHRIINNTSELPILLKELSK